MEEQMKTTLICLAVAFSATHTFAQRSNAGLANSTWRLFFQECEVGARPRPGKWEEQIKITFLPGGKIKDSNEGTWKLTGNRLRVNAPDLVIIGMNATVTSNEINGNACLSMTCRENFCVRLLRDNTAAPAAATDDWESFFKSFRATVNGRNRLGLPKMMASEFSWPGEGAVAPKVWLDFQDRTNAWRTLWRDMQKSLASGTRPYHDPSDPRETRVTNDKAMLFQRGNDGKWRWIGFLGE
jgi:hypothetical protein